MKKRLVIVMPAYNAEKTLVKTYKSIPAKFRKNVILVDDSSNDETVSIAKKLGLKIVVHPQNRGYGGNQKTCYTIAISDGADIVVMLHPDYQYDSSLVGELIEPIVNDKFDLMLGSRIRSRKESLQGGMPTYKYFGNRFLTLVENIFLGQNLSEYHSGFRAFNKKVLKKLAFHKFSDDFVFDQQILISAINNDFRVGEIQVPVRYFSDSSSVSLFKSIKYGVETLITLFKY